MKTLQEMEKMVEGKKGILYSRFIGQMMGYMEKKSENTNYQLNGNLTFIPLKLYYRIASWLFHLNKKDANMLLEELRALKIIIIQRHGKHKGIIVNVVIK